MRRDNLRTGYPSTGPGQSNNFAPNPVSFSANVTTAEGGAVGVQATGVLLLIMVGFVIYLAKTL